MAYEVFPNRSNARGGRGPGWALYPAMSFTRTGVSFNPAACVAYKFVSGEKLCVFLDVERRRIGFKRPANETDESYSFTMCGGGVRTDGRKRQALNLSMKNLPKVFPDAVGRVYRLQLNPGEHVIEAELSLDNMAR